MFLMNIHRFFNPLSSVNIWCAIYFILLLDSLWPWAIRIIMPAMTNKRSLCIFSRVLFITQYCIEDQNGKTSFVEVFPHVYFHYCNSNFKRQSGQTFDWRIHKYYISVQIWRWQSRQLEPDVNHYLSGAVCKTQTRKQVQYAAIQRIIAKIGLEYQWNIDKFW